MSTMSLVQMRDFLSHSISGKNQNKLRGTVAEIDFRNHLARLGFADRVSMGGWVVRRKRNNAFAHTPIALFPEIVHPEDQYPIGRIPTPPHGLHAVCNTLHQSGIQSYYCTATIGTANDYSTLTWQALQLGLPAPPQFASLLEMLAELGHAERTRRHNFMSHHTDTRPIPDQAVPEEFSKEHLRVSIENQFLAEISDIDGVFWGNQITYPLEIKEKTVAQSPDLGPYFGLDLGPFVKLAFYAAMRGQLHSIFVVREIDNVQHRNLLNWWFITFDRLARFASWVPQGGGTNMGGGRSSVVKLPQREFQPLNGDTLAQL
jgi:hypothetical protein